MGPAPGAGDGRAWRGVWASGAKMMLQGELGGGALRIRFLAACSLSHHLLINQHLYGEYRLVVGSLGGNVAISWRAAAIALHQFLKPGLGILHQDAPLAYISQFRPQRLQSKVPGGPVSLVQVYGGYHRLEGFFQD